MSKILTVADIRTEAQRNHADRSAIRRSIFMALLGLAAVAVSTLLPPDEKTATSKAEVKDPPVAQIVTPAAAPEPTEPVGGSLYPQYVTTPIQPLEMAFY